VIINLQTGTFQTFKGCSVLMWVICCCYTDLGSIAMLAVRPIHRHCKVMTVYLCAASSSKMEFTPNYWCYRIQWLADSCIKFLVCIAWTL